MKIPGAIKMANEKAGLQSKAANENTRSNESG